MKFIICFHYKKLFVINNFLSFDYLRYLYRFYTKSHFYYYNNFNKNESRLIVIYDNALIYYNFKFIRLYHDVKILLKYLFLYSFNFNLIEISFLMLKT